MYSLVSTAIIHGIESVPVRVEVDVSDGMPVFDMVGYLAGEVKEARERVRTALKNSGYSIPVKRITVNLYPADIRKSGTGFDLPIAIGVLAAMGIIPEHSLKEVLVTGEISLSGDILPVAGILPMICAAREGGYSSCIIPAGNRREAELVSDMKSYAFKNLKDVIAFLNEKEVYEEPDEKKTRQQEQAKEKYPDFSEIHGQKLLKRACEVAVAGMHNLIMIGPPGAGKTMTAKRIPSILPFMSEEEQMELSKIYSVAGMFEEREKLMNIRPFRSPHHTITPQGLAGGGKIPKPGEISLAHNGVLFLDELTEFQTSTLELLRQPLEEKSINIVRVSGNYKYPAGFMLVCALNPCKCGYYPDRSRCSCSQAVLDRYVGKISKPLLDRIDVCVEAPRLEYGDLNDDRIEETSEQIRERIARAHEIQRERYQRKKILFNSELAAADIKKYCRLDEKEKKYMEDIYQKLNLSARSYHKILKVARTIADLSGREEIAFKDLSEAVCYRNPDKKYWER